MKMSDDDDDVIFSLLLGNGHGSHDEKSFVFQEPVTLKEGENHLVMLGVLTGFPVSNKYNSTFFKSIYR